MSNIEKGRFYWLKLKEDFFEDDAIEWLEEQKNGKEYALFYLKLCLKSLKTNGTLIRRVGTMLVPYDTEKLAEITKTDFDTVVVAMELLKRIGLIEVLESGEIYISSLAAMVGSESRSAERVRQYRERKKLAAESQKALQSNNNVTPCNALLNREKEIEKEIDIDIEKEIYKEKANEKTNEKEASPPLPHSRKKKENAPKQQYGEYKRVLLTEKEFEKLTSEYGTERVQAAIKYLDEYIEEKGYKSKSHNLAIRRWVFDALNEKEQKNSRPQYKGAAEIVTINGRRYEKRSDGKYYVPGGSGIAVNPYERDADSLF